MPLNDDSQPLLGHRGKSCYIPARFVLCLWSFLGFLNLFAMRMDLNVAILAMAASENISEVHNDTLCSHFEGGTDGGGGDFSNTFFQNQSTDCMPPVFDWSHAEKNYLLGAFFYGYSSTQIVGGILAMKFGGKLILGLGVLVTSILALVTPVAAGYSYALLFACRVTQGMAQGLSQPCIHTIWSKWAPEKEKSKLMTITFSGTKLGIVIATLATAYICDSQTLGGWPAVFYIYGGFGVLWWVCWVLLIHDSPEQHPRISETEKKYLDENVPKGHKTPTGNPPWCRVLMSPAMLAIFFAHFANDWGNFALTTCLPTYLKEILNFNITQNGILASLPIFVLLVTTPLSGYVADTVIKKGWMSRKNTRKLMNSTGLFIPSGLMLGVCFMDSNHSLIVALLTLAIGTTGFTTAGYSVNHSDIAPSFAGILYGITNTVGTSAGFIGPAIVKELTEDRNTAAEWRIFFYITAGIFFLGGLMFLLFAQATPQTWELPCSKTDFSDAESNNVAPTNSTIQDADEDDEGYRRSDYQHQSDNNSHR